MKKTFTNKATYNFRQLINVFSKPDYFHERLKCRESGIGLNESYYLDFRPKAAYPEEIDDGVPILDYYGQNIFFPVTVANYFLGLLEGPFEEFLKTDFNKLFIWYQENSENFLVQHKFDERNFKNKAIWYSGLAQAMFLSVFIRATAKGYYQKEEMESVIEGLYVSFKDPAIASQTVEGFVEEYPIAENRVLNGFLFVIFAYHDYYLYTGDRTAFDQSVEIVADRIHEYRVGLYWSRYDIRIFASPFYHKLHVDMLNALVMLTGNQKIAGIARKFRFGNKIKLIFLFFKVLEKLLR